ncbi:unnamed protein product [Effrenium voratum]|uniref:Uncharacterized protein n=1 Tax=Effrenium voratum TaxID=2562239 RepID=A0AA36N2V1_9DINO|nr:unnamed protein product [Effrenium voratum]
MAALSALDDVQDVHEERRFSLLSGSGEALMPVQHTESRRSSGGDGVLEPGLPPPEDHFTKTALASLLDAQEDVKRLLSSLCHKFEALHAERAIERPEKLPEKKHRGSLSKQRSGTLASLQGSEPRRIQANRGERGSKPHTRHRQHQRRCVCLEFHALQEVAQEADLRRSARGLRQARFFGRAGRARPARRHPAGAQPRTGAAAGATSLALERRGGQRLRLGGLLERHAPGGQRGESIGMLDSLPHSLPGEKARSAPAVSSAVQQIPGARPSQLRAAGGANLASVGELHATAQASQRVLDGSLQVDEKEYEPVQQQQRRWFRVQQGYATHVARYAGRGGQRSLHRCEVHPGARGAAHRVGHHRSEDHHQPGRDLRHQHNAKIVSSERNAISTEKTKDPAIAESMDSDDGDESVLPEEAQPLDGRSLICPARFFLAITGVLNFRKGILWQLLAYVALGMTAASAGLYVWSVGVIGDYTSL